MIIQATIKFEVVVTLHGDTFESKLIEVVGGKEQGELKGDIERNNGVKIFTVNNSDLHGKLHGFNIGFQFYVATIKKCLDSRNESIGTTESISPCIRYISGRELIFSFKCSLFKTFPE